MIKIALCNDIIVKMVLCQMVHDGASFVGYAYQGKDIVFRFIVEYSSLRVFSPWVIIGLFLYEDF